MKKMRYRKCERLLEEAIQKAKQAKEESKEADRCYSNFDIINMDIIQEKAYQHRDEAANIYRILASKGFKHDRMKELLELL